MLPFWQRIPKNAQGRAGGRVRRGGIDSWDTGGASGRAALSLALFSPGARGLNPASAASVRGGARYVRARGGEPLVLHNLLVESRFSLHTRGLRNSNLNLVLHSNATVVPWGLSGNRPAKHKGPPSANGGPCGAGTARALSKRPQSIPAPRLVWVVQPAERSSHELLDFVPHRSCGRREP